MFLAGNGSSGTQNKTASTAQGMALIPRPSAGDGYVENKTHAASPCLSLPSPISVTSSGTNELATVKPVGAVASSANQTKQPKPVSSAGPASATLIPAGITLFL